MSSMTHCLGSCDVTAGSGRRAEAVSVVLYHLHHSLLPLRLPLSCSLLMAVPLDVVITHLQTHGEQKNSYTLSRKLLFSP